MALRNQLLLSNFRHGYARRNLTWVIRKLFNNTHNFLRFSRDRLLTQISSAVGGRPAAVGKFIFGIIPTRVSQILHLYCLKLRYLVVPVLKFDHHSRKQLIHNPMLKHNSLFGHYLSAHSIQLLHMVVPLDQLEMDPCIKIYSSPKYTDR